MKLQSQVRRWEVVAGVVQATDALNVVEVGCKEGRLTSYLLANIPGVRVHAVDPWDKEPESNPLAEWLVTQNDESYSGWGWSSIKAEFDKNTEPYADRLDFIQDFSVPAATRFEPETIDVVFIDGAHDYENVHADIAAWWPKVKPNGYLMGHDYQHKFPGVHRAVAAHFGLLRVAVMPDSCWCVPKTGGIKR